MDHFAGLDVSVKETSGHAGQAYRCLLLGVKRTSAEGG
jgi:hypothetical protein